MLQSHRLLLPVMSCRQLFLSKTLFNSKKIDRAFTCRKSVLKPEKLVIYIFINCQQNCVWNLLVIIDMIGNRAEYSTCFIANSTRP